MGAPKQKWTSEEESALKAGVVKHGAGKWRTILKDPEFSGVLSLRSNVDLKDKWRNMSVTANGWGSREKARMALKKSRQIPKQEVAPLALSTVDDHDDEIVDVKPLAVASVLPLLTSPRKLVSKIDSLIFEAITNLKEPSGSNKTAITMYIEDQYSAPPNLKKLLSIKLKALTANGKLSKVKRRYRIPPNLAQSEKRRTKTKVLLLEGRQKEPSRVDKNDIKVLTKPQIDAELARMRNMTAEEAAVAAAQAVAEAEEAMAEAEEAAMEAEAAEADAEAAEAFAEAALKTLKKRAKSMAGLKLGSKSDAFHRQGLAWFCATGLPSDVTVEVGEMSFHLHKFPLLSKSILLEKLIAEKSKEEEEGCFIKLPDVPGDSKSFELVAKFCYGVKLELTASNVAYLRCAAEYLQMTEEVTEGNLISQTETFINQVVLRSWKDSLKALQTCEDLLPYAEDLNIVKRCIESLAVKACKDPNLFGWPMMEHGLMQSPGGSVLWNGISTGARPRSCSSDWWYEDVSSLSLPTYKRVIAVMESLGIKADIIAGSLTSYAKRYIHGLNKRQNTAHVTLDSAPSEEKQRNLLEEIDRLLPFQKSVTSTKFLCNLLRFALILKASSVCVSNLESRIGMQLDEAALEDLLMPTFSYSMETLYDVDCIQRILEHFLALDQETGGASPGLVDDEQLIGSLSLTPITTVAKLIDGYLAEVAPDVNLKLPKFQSLAATVPEYARPLDDGLYRAIDIYLKAHPWISESEREELCRLMDCQKLSLEACTHAAQNERLPLRVVVQVLFFEQLQLRTSIAGCFLVSDNLDGGSRALRSGLVGPSEGGGWATSVRDNQVLKVGMDHMRTRVSELEKECSTMRLEIERLGQGRSGGWTVVPKKFGFKLKLQMCSAKEDSVSGHQRSTSEKIERLLNTKLPKHKRSLSIEK